MGVPFISLVHSTRLVHDVVLKAWNDALATSTFIGGVPVGNLERRLEARLAVNNCVACANGTDAIVLALLAAGIREGDLVAVPNLTFWATYEAVVNIGAIPVLVDIDADDLQMCARALRDAHSRFSLRGVILPHLFGWASAQLSMIRNFCRDNEVILIEDGAQSFGVSIHDCGVQRPIFAGSDMSTLSFYPAKVFGGCMDGGAVVCKDAHTADTCRRLGNHGRSAHYSFSEVGWNSRMSSMQALFLLELEGHIDAIIEARRKALARYFEDLGTLHPKVRVVTPPTGVIGNGYLCVLRLYAGSSDRFVEKMGSRGVCCGRVYPETISMQPAAKDALRASSLDRSTDFCRQVVNLPLYYGISDQEISVVVNAVRETLDELV